MSRTAFRYPDKILVFGSLTGHNNVTGNTTMLALVVNATMCDHRSFLYVVFLCTLPLTPKKHSISNFEEGPHLQG